MPPLVVNAAALAVAALYYFWRDHHLARRRRRVLSRRVAFMLWVMANQIEDGAARAPASCGG